MSSMGVLVMLLAVGVSLAQESCAVFLEEALAAVETNCDVLGRNQACYGYNRVEASFLADVTDDFFAQPADVTDIAEIETLRTAPLALNNDEWGVAVMVLQANLPDTLPGQNVTFVLMGDTEIENAVDPDEAFQAADLVPVTIGSAQGASVRSGADTTFNSIGTLTTGTSVDADGVSDDGAWVRIIFNDRLGWVQRTVIAEADAIDTLPTLSNDIHTPMQAFYLRTGIGQTTCSDIPDDSLMIQGPEDITVQITVNGANIELGSTGMLRMVEDADGNPVLDIAVLDGQFVVKADEHNPVDVVIPAGHHTQLCMSDIQNSGLDGEANDREVSCGASEPERIPPALFDDAWCSMEQMPANLLNYALSSCYDTHTVQSDENLFRIAQNYCVTLDDLAALNDIANINNIVVGTVLTLPLSACAGTGATTPPASTNPPISDDPAPPDDAPLEVVDEVTDDVATNGCASFTVAPQTVTDNVFTLDWRDVDGATNYVVAVFDENNIEVQTIPTAESALTTNGGNFPSVGYIDVRAYDDTDYLCYARFNFTRLGVPESIPDRSDNEEFTARATCTYESIEWILEVFWRGAPETPVSISWTLSEIITGIPSSTTSDDSAGEISVARPTDFTSVTVSSGNENITIEFPEC